MVTTTTASTKKKTKKKTSTLELGQTFETVFTANRRKDSPFRFRATRVDGRAAEKVILCNDSRIQPGKPCRVRISSIKKPLARGRGHIEVEWLRAVLFSSEDDFYVDPVLANKLQALLERGVNILLDGPQGCGKTVLSRRIASVLGMHYVFFNCSSVFEATDFIAKLELQGTESGGIETVWVPTDVLRTLEAAAESPRERFLIFLDEFNRCREMARNGIMPALDSTRRIHNPISQSTLVIPENVLWIAAVNNGAQFTGTTSVDPAQLDRFAPIRMDYPPPEHEERILATRYPDVSRADVKRVVQVASAIRKDEHLQADLSVRATEEVCLLLEHPNFADAGVDALPEILKSSFCGRFQGRWDDAGTDAGLVWGRVEAVLHGD